MRGGTGTYISFSPSDGTSVPRFRAAHWNPYNTREWIARSTWSSHTLGVLTHSQALADSGLRRSPNTAVYAPSSTTVSADKDPI